MRLFLLLSSIGLVSVNSLSAQTPPRWSVIETAKNNQHRLASVPLPALSSTSNATRSTITIDPAQRFQEMVGFGGALTESSAWALAQLPPERRAEVIRRYYDPKDGIGYTLARTHINSCDFSLHLWALDETPGDYDLHDFTLAPMRTWVLPLIHEAQVAAGTGRFHLLASPWSPPAWMKTNNRMDDGGSLRREYAPAWANYFVKFCEAMAGEEKIPVWALTIQNEPDAHQTWESCLYSHEQERDFVRDHLGPALTRAGLTEVKLLGLDHNRDLLEARAAAMLGDPQTARYLWGMGVHWYVSQDHAAASRVHERFPDKHLLFTEGCWEGGQALGAWEHGEGYAKQMIADFNHWLCGFIDWNIALDQRGGPNHVGNFCDAPVLVDTVSKEVRYGPSFYYIAQFSKFVQPGAHRIGSQVSSTEMPVVAFANPDGSLVVVILNAADQAAAFSLAVGDESVRCEIPAHAIQTYLRAGH